MSRYQMLKPEDASKPIEYVTVTGRLEPLTEEDYMKLVRLAHEFRKAVLVDPGGTSSSQEHRFLMERYGLDKHTVSAYLIALRYVQDGKTMNNYKACKQPE